VEGVKVLCAKLILCGVTQLVENKVGTKFLDYIYKQVSPNINHFKI
jgi:hypothetical protein